MISTNLSGVSSALCNAALKAVSFSTAEAEPTFAAPIPQTHKETITSSRSRSRDMDATLPESRRGMLERRPQRESPGAAEGCAGRLCRRMPWLFRQRSANGLACRLASGPRGVFGLRSGSGSRLVYPCQLKLVAIDALRTPVVMQIVMHVAHSRLARYECAAAAMQPGLGGIERSLIAPDGRHISRPRRHVQLCKIVIHLLHRPTIASKPIASKRASTAESSTAEAGEAGGRIQT